MGALHLSIAIDHVLDDEVLPSKVARTGEAVAAWLRAEPEHLLWLWETGLVRLSVAAAGNRD